MKEKSALNVLISITHKRKEQPSKIAGSECMSIFSDDIMKEDEMGEQKLLKNKYFMLSFSNPML